MEIFPFKSHRSLTYAGRGMVATSNHLAAGVGLDILRRGGNAIDAAIATAAALTVLEPCSNGLGGDAFAIVWYKGKLYGLNSSGPAPLLSSADSLRVKGFTEMPRFGWDTVTVPGIPAAWAALQKHFGSFSLSESLEPAIDYAKNGFAITPMVAASFASEAKKYRASNAPALSGWFETFTPNGHIPQKGEIVYLPDHAASLHEIGLSDAESFYRGSLADKIDTFSQETGGTLRANDLAAFYPEWVEPISTDYRGFDIWELPPNGQGLIALSALAILRAFSFDSWNELAIHHQIESLKLAAVDGYRYISDPDFMPIEAAHFLTEEYVTSRRALISDVAIDPLPIELPRSGTVYLCTADEESMVSFIQSNYDGFGSGIVVPGTGIALQSRASCFSLEAGHINELQPGKRPFHTIIPGFITRNGVPVGPFGVMGKFMQPQGHVQLLSQLLDFGANPQSALDAPRWCWESGRKVLVEPDFPPHMTASLIKRGHELVTANDIGLFGRGQVILRDASGSLIGGTEPRADGAVLGW